MQPNAEKIVTLDLQPGADLQRAGSLRRRHVDAVDRYAIAAPARQRGRDGTNRSGSRSNRRARKDCLRLARLNVSAGRCRSHLIPSLQEIYHDFKALRRIAPAGVIRIRIRIR
jgi:hypothetical protein